MFTIMPQSLGQPAVRVGSFLPRRPVPRRVARKPFDVKEPPLRPCEDPLAGSGRMPQRAMVADIRNKEEPRPMDRMARGFRAPLSFALVLAATPGLWLVSPATVQGQEAATPAPALA